MYFRCLRVLCGGISRGQKKSYINRDRVLDRTLNCPGGVLADIEGRTPPFVAVHVDTTHVIVPGF